MFRSLPFMLLLAMLGLLLIGPVKQGFTGEWEPIAKSRIKQTQNSPDRSGPISVAVGDLEKQLQSGLKARRPQDFAFIALVVSLVKQDQLPLILVKSTFQWARKKKTNPIQFFERALRVRAAKMGIQI